MFCADRSETIEPILERSDVVALVINLSNATHRLIGAPQLARMKPGDILINLARGGVVDEAALARALHARTIGGAGLDVFDVQPLPPESPLWDAPNTIISPHSSAPVFDRLERTLDIIAENFRRYRGGEAMLNRMTKDERRSLYQVLILNADIASSQLISSGSAANAVKRHLSVTLPAPEISMVYRADRRRKAALIHPWKASNARAACCRKNAPRLNVKFQDFRTRLGVPDGILICDLCLRSEPGLLSRLVTG